MALAEIHQCECRNCQQLGARPERELHRRMNLFLGRLDEQQRRWYVALESQRVGHGGDRLLAQITGMNVETIRRGRRELAGSLEGRPVQRVRLAGGRRPLVEEKDPDIEQALADLVEAETGGDPLGEQKWVRRSLRQLSRELKHQGHEASPMTVRRLLKKWSIP